MKLLFPVLIFFSSLTASSQHNTSEISIGHKVFHYSKLLKEKREIWVHVPDNVKKRETDNRYPVVYVLDGDQHFTSVTGIVHQMSESTGNTSAPQMIVVSVLSPDRTRDFTPTHQTGGPYNDPDFSRTSGGGEAFTSYLEKELIPFIDSLYPTAPYRTLIGHSLGGLFVVNTLLNHTNLFNAYIALEPSLWWDYNLMLKQSSTALTHGRFTGKTFYMAIGNTMNAAIDTAVMRKDTTEASLQVRMQFNFADSLKAKVDAAGLRWSYGYYKDEAHNTIPLIGEYDGLKYIFDYHKITDFNRLWDPGFNADSAIRNHFQTVSARLGYTVHPPRDLMDGIGHAFLEFHLESKAADLFALNILNYPKWAGSYTAMGDLYAAKKDYGQAASCYRRSLAITNDMKVKKKLATLIAKK